MLIFKFVFPSSYPSPASNYTGCLNENAQILQCHIFKKIEFDVFSNLAWVEIVIERFDEITAVHWNFAGSRKSAHFEPRNNTENYKQDSFRH